VDRLTHYLYSRKNLVGSLLALGGLALHFGLMLLVGGPGLGLLFLPVVVGLYLAGALLTPGEPQLDLVLDASADSEEVRRGLDRLVKQVRGRVAPDIQAKVESIRDSILVTLDAEGGRVAGDPTVHLIRQTALDYLPTALASYLALPRAYAERRAVAGGRTPHAALLEQLDLMDVKMKDAADAILAHDSEKLLANGRFLADRFAVSSLSLDAPGAAAAPTVAPSAPAVAEAGPSSAPAPVSVPAVAEAAAAPVAATQAQPAAERERVN